MNLYRFFSLFPCVQPANERVIIDFTVNGERPDFVPDGMTIDEIGRLYIATWGASKIFVVNPANKKVEHEIVFPCEQVTSAAFGGPNLDILYVTTAATDRSKPQPLPAGRVFKVTGLGVKGLPMKSVKLNWRKVFLFLLLAVWDDGGFLVEDNKMWRKL